VTGPRDAQLVMPSTCCRAAQLPREADTPCGRRCSQGQTAGPAQTGVCTLASATAYAGSLYGFAPPHCTSSRIRLD
jgi:hypothetical protein